MVKLRILRCGYCGVFCDNYGNEFEATEQLKAADKHVGFENALGECKKCRPIGLDEIAEHNEINEMLAKQKDQFYRRYGAVIAL